MEQGSILRAAISTASNERTSRLWTRAALFEHAAAPGSSGTRGGFCGFAVRAFQVNCGSKVGPSPHIEPEPLFASRSSSKGSGRARAAISSASPRPSRARGASFERPGATERARAANFSSFFVFVKVLVFSEIGSKALERVQSRIRESRSKR